MANFDLALVKSAGILGSIIFIWLSGWFIYRYFRPWKGAEYDFLAEPPEASVWCKSCDRRVSAKREVDLHTHFTESHIKLVGWCDKCQTKIVDTSIPNF